MSVRNSTDLTTSKRRCGWRRVALRVQNEPACLLGRLGRCCARHPQSSSGSGSPVGYSTGRIGVTISVRARKDVEGVGSNLRISNRQPREPEAREPDLHDTGAVRQGWQQEATSRVEQHFRASLFTIVPEQVQAVEVPIKLWSKGSIDTRSHESGDYDPISIDPRASPPPLSLSMRNCRLTIHVPSSSSSCASGDVGSARLRTGECGRKDLLRGLWTGPNQHACQGHGFGCPSERAQIGGGG